MRKVVYGVGISLDGYIARRDGSVDFLFMPKDYSMAPFFKRIDTGVMGRKTFEVGLKLGGEKNLSSPRVKFYVFSNTLDPGEKHHAMVVRESPQKLLGEIRNNQGKDIWLMGGGELARDFLREDLVDEIYLGVVPVMIGEGIPAFPAGFPQREFTLVENKTYSKGMIALRYERNRSAKIPKRKATKP